MVIWFFWIIFFLCYKLFKIIFNHYYLLLLYFFSCNNDDPTKLWPIYVFGKTRLFQITVYSIWECKVSSSCYFKDFSCHSHTSTPTLKLYTTPPPFESRCGQFFLFIQYTVSFPFYTSTSLFTCICLEHCKLIQCRHKVDPKVWQAPETDYILISHVNSTIDVSVFQYCRYAVSD